MTSLFDTKEFNERLFFPRRHITSPPPFAKDFEVKGEATIHVRWHAALASAPTVLLFHGNGETVADYDHHASIFAEAGANLAVADYRGYGQSSGTSTLRNAMADASRVVADVHDRIAAPIVVMGRSLGSACAADLYARAPVGVVGFIIESGFSDLATLVRRRDMTPPTVFSESDIAAFDPLPKLRRGAHRLLVLHGARDTMIAPSEARETFQAAAAAMAHKELVEVPARGHNDISASPVYWDAMARFFRTLG